MSSGLLQNSHGNKPQVVQDDIFPEGIVAIDHAAESRSLLVGTRAGHITLLNSRGEQIRTARSYSGLRKLVWSDNGMFGAAVLGPSSLVCFGADLKPRWDAQFTGNIVGLAVSPYGSHLAVSSDSSRTHVVTTDRREVARFDSPRPLDFLHFLHEKPQLLGAAEFGHLCCQELDGTEVWEERIMNNVGGMSVSGCGRRILLAAFNHGIQVLNSSGKQRGSFMIDGIPNAVSASAIKSRLAATTLESRVYWLNFDGELIWAADLSQDPPQQILAGPLADRMFLTTQSGRLLQLVWGM